jgi:uncharacterized membrane-anchored protein
MPIFALALALTLALVAPMASAQEAELTPEQVEYLIWAKGVWDSLDRQHGRIDLPGVPATLDVPEDFYYLKPADATKVLTEVWGNPPNNAEGLLGMLFPAEATPFDSGSWAVTIAYDEDGYVSDADAKDIDYDVLLAEMREATQAANEQRAAAGYPPIALIGWAAKPFYDQASHKLHWAREVKFGDQPEHTLNYGIRVLGRQGVLVLNFVADMDQKDLIAGELDKVLAMAEFKPGSRYADYTPGMDKVAAYGIGGLIAGKVMAKAGLFAAALIFLKKFGVLIVLGLGALVAKLRRKAT